MSDLERGAETQWDAARFSELGTLQRLVREVSTINRGNHCLERIAECIELAEKLDATNFRTGRRSFIGFLDNLAITASQAMKE
jgi:hypothetical protein